MTRSRRQDTALCLAILAMAGVVGCCPLAAAEPSPSSPVDSPPRVAKEAGGRAERSGHSSAKSPKHLPSTSDVTNVPAAPTPNPGKTVRPAVKTAEPSHAEATVPRAASRHRAASGRRPSTSTGTTRRAARPVIDSSAKRHRPPVNDHATTGSPAASHELNWDATASDERPDTPPHSAPANRINISSPVDDDAVLPLVAGPEWELRVALGGDVASSAAIPGSVAMLMVVAVGVALGYRQAKQHDVGRADVMRFIS